VGTVGAVSILHFSLGVLEYLLEYVIFRTGYLMGGSRVAVLFPLLSTLPLVYIPIVKICDCVLDISDRCDG